MLPEELQSVGVDLDGAPGVGFGQIGKILFTLLQGQLIGAAIEIVVYSSDSPRISGDGLLTVASMSLT